MTRAKREFSYTFSPQETELLARFLRDHDDALPDGLSNFAHFVEKVMFSSMSVGEAEKFYCERADY